MKKRCKECDELLPLSGFYRHSKMADGHLNFCKTCVKARVAKHRNENLEAVRAYDRQRSRLPHRQRQLREWSDQLRSDPVKLNTWRKTSNAIRDKKLVRPGNCSECQCECTPDAHHPDYTKPFEVIWLCRSCHCKLHAKAKEVSQM